MRRWLCLVLALFLTASSACAGSPVVLQLWDLTPPASLKRAHPEIRCKALWHDPFRETLAEMQRLQPDVAFLSLYNDDWQLFLDAEFTADLSSSAVIKEAVSRMPEWIQQLVTTADGRIWALPITALVRPVYWYQDAWDAAGLTKEDVPQSYTELLDFLDRWVDRIKAAPEKNICASRLVRWNTGQEKYNYCWCLMDMLLSSHEIQQRHAGQGITFHTPEFIALAERTRQIGLALYEAEPPQGKRQGMLQLFQNDLHGGEHANGGRAYGLSHSIPLRLTSNQPALTSVNLEFAFVRRGSAHPEESLLVLEHLIASRPWFFQYALYRDFAAGDYPFDSRKTGHVDEGWLADYHSFEGDFIAQPTLFHQSLELLNAKETSMLQFFQGSITAEKFAYRLP